MKYFLLPFVAGFVLFAPRSEPPHTTEADAVEINTFGVQPRTAVIYWSAERHVIDWRWLSSPEQVPLYVKPGRYLAAWNDSGTPRIVYCRRVVLSRTKHDVELSERTKLPEHKRTKLR